ncbi:malonyl-CoA decarboxylase, mitochondrial-like [Bacillus rossius redtenbacheri]|uniref:malonyl-CoA decarboxylase, mitochondrial-like n=1 Tax=Bacillus rossius redtenbacheri TaxID=93214 RepID=UPI002FDE623E
MFCFTARSNSYLFLIACGKCSQVKYLNCRNLKHLQYTVQMTSRKPKTLTSGFNLSPERNITTSKPGSPTDDSCQIGLQKVVDTDYYGFDAAEAPVERLSTIEDELQVKNLLKEVLAFQSTQVSNWIVESKVKQLCAAYKSLLKPHREEFLKTLASEYSVDHPAVVKSARVLVELQETGDERQLLRAEERLGSLLSPQYLWLFLHTGRLERGVKFLVDLRTDLLALMSELSRAEGALSQLQQLDRTLRELLSLWFSVGFLALERVTWRSPCELLQKISEYEAVHPVRNWTDLKRRVGPYRRCYVYTHGSMPGEPLVVLHTALCDEIVGSLRGLVSSASRMSVDMAARTDTPISVEEEDPAGIKAAIFYSISSTQKGLKGIELGNYLIKRAVQEVRAEFPLISMFSTLSPVPQFRAWVVDKLKAAERGEAGVLTPEEEERLGAHLGAQGVWAELRRLFHANSWASDGRLADLLEAPLMRLCARYLLLEKRRGYALDSVANFHLKNGAVMWRLNWRADTSPRGLGNSFGIMVNYRYFLEDLETNSRKYQEKQVVSASEQFYQLSAGSADTIASKL